MTYNVIPWLESTCVLSLMKLEHRMSLHLCELAASVLLLLHVLCHENNHKVHDKVKCNVVIFLQDAFFRRWRIVIYCQIQSYSIQSCDTDSLELTRPKKQWAATYNVLGRVSGMVGTNKRVNLCICNFDGGGNLEWTSKLKNIYFCWVLHPRPQQANLLPNEQDLKGLRFEV